MEGVEVQRQVVSEREAEQRAEAARLTDLTAQSEQSRQTFSEKLAALQHQRQLAAEQIGPSTIVLFDRLSERYEGDVMAGIERTHPRRDEFICGGCHMTLSAELANALMVHDDVLTCKNCGRILHIEKGT